MAPKNFLAYLLVSAAWTSYNASASSGDPAPAEVRAEGDGITHEIYVLDRENSWSQTIWIYRPSSEPETKLPLVVVPPAGGNMISAPELSNADKPEHLPYVRAGFLGVSTTFQGQMAADPADLEFIEILEVFRSSRAGVRNVESALDLALRSVGYIDEERVYVAGHSSAATLALLVATDDERIRGAADFAPVWNIPEYLGSEVVADIDSYLSGFGEFLNWNSPINQIENYRVPLFIFHSKADAVVPYGTSEDAVSELTAAGVEVDFRTAASGDHYSSMIQAGIPAAIEWFRSLNDRKRRLPLLDYRIFGLNRLERRSTTLFSYVFSHDQQ